MALFLFRVTKDNLNVSTVLLNSSCLLRKFAKLISVRSLLQSHHNDLEKYCENAGINDDGVNGVETLFNRAISLCNEAHNNLGEKGEISNIKIFQGNNVSSRHLPKHLHLIWEGISNEIALCQLSVGIYRKVLLQHNESKKTNSEAMKLEKSVIEPISIASRIFSDLKSDRMVALCDFHLGDFFCHFSPNDMPITTKRADFRLENALKCYHRAYNYYTKYDIGPTLLMILIDMCNLYLLHFNVSENAIYAYAEQVKLSRQSFELMDTKTSSASSLLSSTNDKCSRSEATEIVISLLGGAFQTLLESRFAFTPAVIETHGVEEINNFVKRIIKPLTQVLMKILKCISLNILTIKMEIDDDYGNDAEIKSMRSICAELLRLDLNSSPIQASKLYELLDTLNSMKGLKNVMQPAAT